VNHIDAEVDHVELAGDEWVEALHTKDGRRLEFDLYIDCTGFRSVLLGGALGTKYHSYADSLFTDSALTGYTPQSEAMEPYTTAATMDAGWCWTIPVPGEDHVGYVYSSSFRSDDRAAEEMLRRHPDVGDLKTVRFRSGRHDKMWRGNVIALGNAYGFVEPLESSALLMLAFSIMSMMPLLPASWKEPDGRTVLNDLTAAAVGRPALVPRDPLQVQHPAEHRLLARGAGGRGRLGRATAARRLRLGCPRCTCATR
jgi:tryptophan halogenase